jgi:NAD(P)-dependent dehydrogenase (short-subunit alcohol dehydrogenase family)
VEATVRAPAGALALAELAERHGGRIRIHTLDVASDASAEALGARLSGPVDAVVNNAGAYDPTQDLARVRTDDVLALISLNALGALRVTRALLPRLLEGKGKRVLNLSTGMAILGEPNDGRAYAYRMSKVALNMMTRTMAANLRGDGVLLAVIDPGWVQTAMGGPGATTPVGQSVTGVIAWLDRMGPEDSGDFLHYRGGKLPW